MREPMLTEAELNEPNVGAVARHLAEAISALRFHKRASRELQAHVFATVTEQIEEVVRSLDLEDSHGGN